MSCEIHRSRAQTCEIHTPPFSPARVSAPPKRHLNPVVPPYEQLPDGSQSNALAGHWCSPTRLQPR
eukprot:54862-Eustigmatos_ZCMA.PRE.1